MAEVQQRPPEQKEDRINVLSRHKTIVPAHVHDRRSVYWVDRQPLGPPTVMAMTPRLEILSKSRRNQQYKFNRDEGYGWEYEPFYREIKITKGENIPAASPRVEALSAHKEPHSKYEYDRDLPTTTSDKVPEATPRIETLSRSKTTLLETKLGPHDRFFYPYLPQPVSEIAMKGQCSARVDVLAEHRKVPAAFREERPIQWSPNEDSLIANASLRVCQLARPRSRNLAREDDFDPYLVSKGAKSAIISPRVEELAAPIPRKVRTKKAG